MKNRNKTLKEILPEISTIERHANTSATEVFQNEVLRPILKFQHSFLLSVFLHEFRKHHKNDLRKIAPNDLRQKVKMQLSKHQKTRNLLLGSILGLCSPQQINTYYDNEGEYKRRIFSMLTERIMDGIKEEYK